MSQTSIMDTFKRYHTALEDGNFELAASCFTDDALFSHPSYTEESTNGQQRIELIGSAAIRQLLQEKRRGRPDVHSVESFLEGDGQVFIEGCVHDRDGNLMGTFLCSGRFDDTWRFTRWVAFGSFPGVGSYVDSANQHSPVGA